VSARSRRLHRVLRAAARSTPDRYADVLTAVAGEAPWKALAQLLAGGCVKKSPPVESVTVCDARVCAQAVHRAVSAVRSDGPDERQLRNGGEFCAHA
jgi:hypothetical protein